MSTQNLVNEEMEAATDKGLEFEAWTFKEAAEDLIQNSSALEDKTPEEVAPLIKVWFLNSRVPYVMYD